MSSALPHAREASHTRRHGFLRTDIPASGLDLENADLPAEDAANKLILWTTGVVSWSEGQHIWYLGFAWGALMQ